jgi:hypothetical protein
MPCCFGSQVGAGLKQESDAGLAVAMYDGCFQGADGIVTRDTSFQIEHESGASHSIEGDRLDQGLSSILI